jgi:hypothetical protein
MLTAIQSVVMTDRSGKGVNSRMVGFVLKIELAEVVTVSCGGAHKTGLSVVRP